MKIKLKKKIWTFTKEKLTSISIFCAAAAHVITEVDGMDDVLTGRTHSDFVIIYFN